MGFRVEAPLRKNVPTGNFRKFLWFTYAGAPMRRERPDDDLVRDCSVHGDQEYFRGLFESSFW